MTNIRDAINCYITRDADYNLTMFLVSFYFEINRRLQSASSHDMDQISILTADTIDDILAANINSHFHAILFRLAKKIQSNTSTALMDGDPQDNILNQTTAALREQFMTHHNERESEYLITILCNFYNKLRGLSEHLLHALQNSNQMELLSQTINDEIDKTVDASLKLATQIICKYTPRYFPEQIHTLYANTEHLLEVPEHFDERPSRVNPLVPLQHYLNGMVNPPPRKWITYPWSKKLFIVSVAIIGIGCIVSACLFIPGAQVFTLGAIGKISIAILTKIAGSILTACAGTSLIMSHKSSSPKNKKYSSTSDAVLNSSDTTNSPQSTSHALQQSHTTTTTTTTTNTTTTTTTRSILTPNITLFNENQHQIPEKQAANERLSLSIDMAQ